MKTKMVIASLTITLIASLSSANSVIENNVLGRQFCQNSNGHLTGIGFSKDGIAYSIDSLAGMPDPTALFKVEHIVGTNQFVINRYSTNSEELMSRGVDRYEYDFATDGLRSGDVVLTAKQCGR